MSGHVSVVIGEMLIAECRLHSHCLWELASLLGSEGSNVNYLKIQVFLVQHPFLHMELR